MMFFSMLPRLAAGAAIALAASASWALSVGRAEGVALIGRPFEVSIPVSLDPGEVNAAQCTQAEVFYGDGRVDQSRVASEFQAAAPGARVRIRSSVPVNEPVVTVYLQLGCTNKVSRRFVLLSEHPDPAAEPLQSATRPPASAVAAPPSRLAAVPGTAPTAAQAARAGREPVLPARAAASAGAVGGNEPARRSARLKLEPLDLSEVRDPALRLSAEMSASPEVSKEQRAQAAALWRALNARPEDMLRETRRLEAMESDLATLRQSTQRNDDAIATLRSELDRARGARYVNPLVFALLALLLAAGAAAFYAWRRSRWHASRGGDWWRTHGDADSDLLSMPAALSVGRASARRPSEGGPLSEPNLDLSFTESALQRLHEQQSSVPSSSFHDARHDDFQHSQSASMRAVRAEELHDVQQEADFFLSLGDHDRAIEVLRNHISLNPGTSPVAWLDLLEIHHKLGRRDEYESVRHELLRTFDVQVPQFDAYRQSHAGLEDYEHAMARIAALWPSRKVLDLIEESIFRKPGQQGAEAFNLEAYRDLLLLHHIGRDVLHGGQFQDSEGASRSDFSNTAIHPLSAQSASEPPPGIVFPTLHHALDVDLDEPAPLATDPSTAPAQPLRPVHANLLDFDLPDIDTTSLKDSKTRD